jgi:hypothetical protein
VQTVKSMRSEAEPMERFEWERQITSPRPELDHAEGDRACAGVDAGN